MNNVANTAAQTEYCYGRGGWNKHAKLLGLTAIRASGPGVYWSVVRSWALFIIGLRERDGAGARLWKRDIILVGKGRSMYEK